MSVSPQAMQQQMAQQMQGQAMPPPPTAGQAQQNLTGMNPATGMPYQASDQPAQAMPPPPTAMQPAPNQYSQYGDNPTQVMPPPPLNPNAAGTPPSYDPNRANYYGGQKIAGADPNQADYQSVQQYSDAALQNARRYLDPQQQAQDRRMQQEMINKGIDPNSAQGRELAAQKGRTQADANNAAAFNAMQFGQGIQNQMFGQEQAQAELAGRMQQGYWGAEGQARGQDMQGYLGGLQNQLGFAGLENQRYGMDLGQQLGMGQLDYQRNMGEHSQMMDLLGYDMNVNQYNQQQQMIQDAMYNQRFNAVPVPGFSATNPYGPAGQMMNAGDTTWWNAEGGAKFGFGG